MNKITVEYKIVYNEKHFKYWKITKPEEILSFKMFVTDEEIQEIIYYVRDCGWHINSPIPILKRIEIILKMSIANISDIELHSYSIREVDETIALLEKLFS